MRGEAVEDEGVGEVVTEARVGRGEAGHRGHEAGGEGGHRGRETHRRPDHRRRGAVMGGGPWSCGSACLLHVFLQLLHVALELGPPVLEPANDLKRK